MNKCSIYSICWLVNTIDKLVIILHLKFGSGVRKITNSMISRGLYFEFTLGGKETLIR